MISVRPFCQEDAPAVMGHVLAIQREEFGLDVTIDEQPDLQDIPTHYLAKGGGFWVAEDAEQIIGTLGLLNIGKGNGVLRKVFVNASMRGPMYSVALRLLGLALDHARSDELQKLWLGTTESFVAAHRFYEKHGFSRVNASDLPREFPRMSLDTRFYCTDLMVAQRRDVLKTK